MLPLRYVRLWMGLGLAALAFGLALALISPTRLPMGQWNDKLVHVSGFVVFATWFGGLVESRRMVVVAAALLGYGVLIELLQTYFTTTRHGEVADVIADFAGILLGWIVTAAGLRHWGRRVESWLVPAPGTPRPPPRS